MMRFWENLVPCGQDFHHSIRFGVINAPWWQILLQDSIRRYTGLRLLHCASLWVSSVRTVSNDREVQNLLRVVRERGLLNLLSNPPVQPCLTKAQRKAEVHSKRKEERQKCALSHTKKSTGLHRKNLKHPKMYPPGLVEPRWLFVLCTLTHNSGDPKLWMVKCSASRLKEGAADRFRRLLPA